MSERVDIPGYPGYQADREGNIYNLKGRKLKPVLRDGYPRLTLMRKACSVHRLIALTFLGPGEPGQVVMHLNHNRQDNRVTNLKWGSYKENNLDARESGRLNPATGRVKVRRSDGKEYESITSAAKDIKRDESAIRKVIKGYRKTTGGFGWELV